MTPRLNHMAAEVARRAANLDAAAHPRMFVDPATYYDADYWNGQKLYRYPDGRGGYELRLYQPPAREWHGFGLVVRHLLAAVAPWRPETVLDIGCGSGSLVAHLAAAGVDAYGVDVSDDAIANPARGAERRIARWNLADGPPPPPRSRPDLDCALADLVTATDLLEHIYESEIDRALAGMLRCVAPGGIFFACVATRGPNESDFVHPSPVEPIPLDREVTAVAGHVNVRSHAYWIRKVEALGARPAWCVMHRFAQGWADDPELSKVVSWGPRFIVAAWPGVWSVP